MSDQSTVCIIIIVCVVGAFVYAYHYGCTVKCHAGRENMTAGLGVTTGLSFYNKGRFCSGGNLEGSSSPYCESPGYVLF